MGVEPPAADLVPTRLSGQGIAEAGEHRAGEHDGAAEGGVALEELRSAEIRRVYVLGAEGIAAIAQLLGSDSHVLQEGDEVIDIQNVGHIVDGYFLPGACGRISPESLWPPSITKQDMTVFLCWFSILRILLRAAPAPDNGRTRHPG